MELPVDVKNLSEEELALLYEETRAETINRQNQELIKKELTILQNQYLNGSEEEGAIAVQAPYNWERPRGFADAYQSGQQTEHKGKTYVSLRPFNLTEPGTNDQAWQLS